MELNKKDIFRVSNASKGQFDIREDEEQYVKLVECLDMLISAGYFRAKIQGLTAFDKIVGGIVWCISLCAHQVDVDLLYSENSTIGQKIALTERIVEVLPKVKCPHTIEPHQIQGLDCIHIFPVIQWLVKEATEVKHKMGDLQQNFSVYQFGQENWKVENDTAAVRPTAKSKKVYRRVVRMKPSGVASTSGLTGQTLMAENSSSSQELRDADQSPQDDELVVCRDGDFTTAMTGQTDGSADSKAFSPAPSDRSSTISNEFSTEQLQEKLNLMIQEEQQLAKELIDQQESYATLKANAQALQLQLDNFNEVTENVDPNVIETLKELLSERDEIKCNESAFKKECRSHIEQLDQQINQLREKEENLEDGAEQEEADDTETKSQQAMLQVTNQLNVLMIEMNELNRQIFQLERQVESRPSQIELNQYQRRFVELYNQMSSKHRETKRQYTLYNTLLDVRNFIKREIDLLNSIDDSKDIALKESYKDSFVENLQKICRSVEESLDKILCRKRGLQEQRDALSDNLQLLVDKQRLYMKTVVEFQTECQKNEQLRQNIEHIE